MSVKKTSRAKRTIAKTRSRPAQAVSLMSMVTQNVVNMVAVTAVSGAVLLALLAVKHF
jgi:hypothetical protein